MINNIELKFKVSGIIPVFRENHFVREAINSVLGQDEVGEILLVENDALEICEEIENQNDKVKIITPSIEKIGNVSANLNLGITRSNFDYVAFLDANDWYLPNRFKKDQEMFLKHANADVVYSSVQSGQNNNAPLKNAKIGDPRKIIGENATPKEFYKFSLLVKQQHPSFHTNSLTIRKKFLLEDKLFDERLRLHQDSELWRRFLRRGNFFAGKLEEPVAVIREHEDNRITSRTVKSRLLMYAVFIENVGVANMYGFEKKYHLKEILRAQSKLLESNWKRRIFFYSQLTLSLLQKDSYLKSFTSNYLSKQEN
ncbi:glycosyltransferase [Salegentibacter sp. F188]|uniref:Glycosyltransferase n=1 Tax=Autumnicola patrickiae TaxID=3075591 RepID=A0ABU3E1H1_9FLAO|nr:glycosyltransferase [Salegentibacter sp. F188]MDT0689806.1 glycosyltransferase [Salegentibacter sp. F188]